VLLAALTVLLALLLPVLQAAEVTGRELSCLEGLRAAGVGLDVYTQDHDGVLPPVADRSRFSGEVFAHDGYDRRSLLAGYATLRACPASGAARPDAAGNTAAVLQGTYAWMAPDPAAVSPAEAVRGQDVLIDAQRGRGGFVGRRSDGCERALRRRARRVGRGRGHRSERMGHRPTSAAGVRARTPSCRPVTMSRCRSRRSILNRTSPPSPTRPRR